MALLLEDLDRLFGIALELKNAGRRGDAELLGRLAAAVGGDRDLRPDLTDDELERILEQGDADIAAGRFMADDEVWARIDAARPVQVSP
jgi:hypothetical protein